MVVCMGLLVCDVIAYPMDARVFERDSTRLSKLALTTGGDALNASVCLARYGVPVSLVGRVGRDAFGDLLVARLGEEGVDTSGVLRRADTATSTSIVMVREDGERHFAYYGACNDSLCCEDLSDALLESAEHLHVASAMALAALDGEGLARLFRRAKARGITTSLDLTHDASGRWLPLVEGALHNCDLFIPSAEEARMLSGTDDPARCCALFRRLGARVAGVKLGARGCYVEDDTGAVRLPSLYQGAPVDTTGAGDAFFAGFLARRLRGGDLRACALFASASAARCLGALGATTGIVGYEETGKGFWAEA